MGRDTDSKWVEWLASSRRNSPGSACGASSISSPSSPSKASSTRSSATSYFALLSANEDGSNDGRSSFANHKQHCNISGSTTRGMDSSWVAWFTEHGHQGRFTDMPDQIMREKGHGSERSFLNINKTLSPTETQQLQMQRYSLPQDPEISNTATTTASAVSVSMGTTSPLPSPSDNLWDSNIDGLGTDLLSTFWSALPFDPTNTQADEAAGPCATAGLDDGDFSWLEEQHAFPFNRSEESGKSSPGSKRSREEYPGDYTDHGRTQLETIANKKQRIYHPWTNPLEKSSPFSY